MQYSNRKDYANRLATLRYMLRNAVSPKGEAAIRRTITETKRENAQHGDVSKLAEVTYRELVAEEK